MRKLIFADWEFSWLNPNWTEFLSLALIKENGDELYLEFDYKWEVVDWVKENVIPYLNSTKLSKEEAKQKILEFVWNDKPYFVSYVNSFDWMWICWLFWVFEVPFYWVPLDFATMLFQKWIIPEMTTPEELAKTYNISLDNHKAHNALDDTRLIRNLYLKIFKK